ncbi:hypothetical protein [Polynucleobacter necessarius]|nr:hypothetical protein [Polynucleobacter necessarius]
MQSAETEDAGVVAAELFEGALGSACLEVEATSGVIALMEKMNCL